MAILLAVMYIPFLNELFTTVPLSGAELAAASAFILIPVLGSEGVKRVLGGGKIA
jgi:ABC-type spermidine/putrescine transport system permease subunit I